MVMVHLQVVMVGVASLEYCGVWHESDDIVVVICLVLNVGL